MRPLLLVEAQGASPTRRAVYRYFRDIQSAGLDVGLLALADHLATYDGPGEGVQWANLGGTGSRVCTAFILSNTRKR